MIRFPPFLRTALLAGLCLSLFAGCSPRERADAPPVVLFAAASLTDALSVIAEDYQRDTGQAVRLSFAASGAVARQVEAGAPAELVVLADRPWMDRLQAAGRLRADSRTDLLGNRLVLVTARDTAVVGEPLDWLGQSGGRLVIGDPESVPAGAYARTWLQKIGRWDALSPAIVTAADVRAVRAFVSRGEGQLGVVYRSDAIGFDEVRVVGEPPAGDQPDIVYPAALTAAASPAAAAFLAHLRSDEAGRIFERYGFEPLS